MLDWVVGGDGEGGVGDDGKNLIYCTLIIYI